MKNLSILLILLFLSRCASDVQPVQNLLGTNVSTQQNESVVVSDATHQSTPVSVTVLAITDSRCPSNVNCIWAGQASVSFSIDSYTFSLLIGQSKEFLHDNQPLVITLKDVTPYPSTFNGNVKKVAVFAITHK